MDSARPGDRVLASEGLSRECPRFARMADHRWMIDERRSPDREPGVLRMTGLFADLSGRLEMKILDSGVERYGAWEWCAFREENARAEYVIISVLERPNSSTCGVELWRGFDNGV